MVRLILDKNHGDFFRRNVTALLDGIKTDKHSRLVVLSGKAVHRHPDFEWLVARLLEKDCVVAVEVNPGSEDIKDVIEKNAFLPILWTPVINVFDDDSSLRSAIKLIESIGLKPTVKMEFLVKDEAGNERALKEEDYAAAASDVMEKARKAADGNVSLEYGVGLPDRVFSDEQLGVLWRLGCRFPACAAHRPNQRVCKV